MCAQYQINREPGLLNQSDGQMRNNEGYKETFNCWGCPEQPGIRVESSKMVKLKNPLSVRPLLIVRWLLAFGSSDMGKWSMGTGAIPEPGPADCLRRAKCVIWDCKYNWLYISMEHYSFNGWKWYRCTW